MESSGGVTGSTQEAVSNLSKAAQDLANVGVNAVRQSANAGGDAVRGEAQTLLKGIGETFGHLQTLFDEISNVLVGE